MQANQKLETYLLVFSNCSLAEVWSVKLKSQDLLTFILLNPAHPKGEFIKTPIGQDPPKDTFTRVENPFFY